MMEVDQELSARLRAFYQGVANDFQKEEKVPDVYEGPFLTSCPKHYQDLQIRWMYVGQEGELEALTKPVDVAGIMETYEAFNLAETYRYPAAPFWVFAHDLDRQFNPNGPARSFIWSNLSRIKKRGVDGPVPAEVSDFWVKHRLLANEIEILRPDFVLFVIGNDYDDLLMPEFPGIKVPTVSHQCPVVQIKGLPVPAIKTYHPNHLRQSRLEARAKESIFSEVGAMKRPAA